MRGEFGAFVGGRIKLGLNYNFLSNKYNNIGVGVAYMREVIADVEGGYTLVESTDQTAVTGNLRASGTGVKVQLTYGFGLKKAPWKSQKIKKDTGLRSPWYFGLRYGTKNYLSRDESNLDFANTINGVQIGSIFLGHYVKQKLALEFGLESSEFLFLTPLSALLTPSGLGIQRLNLLTVPFALKYDVLQSNRFTAYGKGVFSTDFRLDQGYSFFIGDLGQITDESKLLLNAGIEAGIDFRLFGGVTLGVTGRYNHAFRNAARIEFPVQLSENEFEFQGYDLKNQYLSWGVELKYLFNRNR